MLALAFWLFVVPGLAFIAFCFMLIGAYFPEKTITVGYILADAAVSVAKQIFTVLV